MYITKHGLDTKCTLNIKINGRTDDVPDLDNINRTGNTSICIAVIIDTTRDCLYVELHLFPAHIYAALL